MKKLLHGIITGGLCVLCAVSMVLYISDQGRAQDSAQVQSAPDTEEGADSGVYYEDEGDDSEYGDDNETMILSQATGEEPGDDEYVGDDDGTGDEDEDEDDAFFIDARS